jgi:hypothetical protein
MTNREQTMTVAAGAVLLLAAIVGGTVWLLRDEPQPELVVLLPPEEASEATHAAAPTSVASFAPSKSQVESSQTSWQDPFTAAHWASGGWKFVENSMQTSATPAQATFHRTYRKLRISASIERLSGEGACEFRLYAPETGSATVISVNGTLEVAETQHATRTLIEQADIAAALEPGLACSVDIAASGNRIQLAINGRRLLTCDQPAAQSGRDLTLTLACSDSEWKISVLRIEGE